MIKKKKIGGMDGYAFEANGKGFFLARTIGKMPNGARFDKISISGTYDQSGATRISTKKLGSKDVHRGRTYSTAAINTDLLPQFLAALTMLAAEIGTRAAPQIQDADMPEPSKEQRESSEVQDWIDEHAGRVSL